MCSWGWLGTPSTTRTSWNSWSPASTSGCWNYRCVWVHAPTPGEASVVTWTSWCTFYQGQLESLCKGVQPLEACSNFLLMGFTHSTVVIDNVFWTSNLPVLQSHSISQVARTYFHLIANWSEAVLHHSWQFSEPVLRFESLQNSSELTWSCGYITIYKWRLLSWGGVWIVPRGPQTLALGSFPGPDLHGERRGGEAALQTDQQSGRKNRGVGNLEQETGQAKAPQ